MARVRWSGCQVRMVTARAAEAGADLVLVARLRSVTAKVPGVVAVSVWRLGARVSVAEAALGVAGAALGVAEAAAGGERDRGPRVGVREVGWGWPSRVRAGPWPQGRETGVCGSGMTGRRAA